MGGGRKPLTRIHAQINADTVCQRSRFNRFQEKKILIVGNSATHEREEKERSPKVKQEISVASNSSGNKCEIRTLI